MMNHTASPTDTPPAVDSLEYRSGIVVVWATTGEESSFCREIARIAQTLEQSFAFIYYSGTAFNAHSLCESLHSSAPELRFCGCSTSGEITPLGIQTRGAVAVLLPGQWFRIDVSVIEHIASLGMHDIAQQAAARRTNFMHLQAQWRRESHTPSRAGHAHAESMDDVFAVSLIDGLTYAEETVTAALNRGLDTIPMIGGSAGDDLALLNTTQICNGRVYSGAAILTLIQCRLPYELFSEINFVATDRKLVVTDSDIDRRRVLEFNAEPAAVAYANAIGVPINELSFRHFASNPLVVSIGGQCYCRAIQCCNDDLSLSFLCAIDNGIVLTVARSTGMIASAIALFDRLEGTIGPIDMLFGFDCIHRRLDAENRNVLADISSLYVDRHFVGFNAYGEQFRSMHLNQTFTGVAFGLPAGAAAKPESRERGATAADSTEPAGGSPPRSSRS